MKNIRFVSLTFFFVVLFSSCIDLLDFSMEQLQPGQLVAPMKHKNLLIVDNSALQPFNKGHYFAVNKKNIRDTAFLTAPLSGYLTHSLRRNLSELELFDKISEVSNSQLSVPKVRSDDYLFPTPLSRSIILSLSEKPSNQLVFSLDLLQITTFTQIQKDAYEESATRDVWLRSYWRVYDLDSDTLLAEFTCMDSLYWYKTKTDNRSAVSQLPMLDSVLEEVGDVLAQKVASQAFPSWVKVNREYYRSGSLRMRNATDLVKQNKLEAAAKLWEMVYAKSVFRSKYRAAFNLVMYNEIMGRLDLASEWLLKAEEAMKKSPFGIIYYDDDVLTWWKVHLPELTGASEKLKKIFDEN